MKPIRLGLMLCLLALVSSAPRADEAPKAPVDRHGDPLPKFARDRLGTVRFRQGGQVATLRFAADGKTLLTAGVDNSLRSWDVKTGRETGVFAQSAANGGPRELFNGNALDDVIDDPAPGGSWVVSPDGRVLASFDYSNQTIQLLDLTNGKELHKIGPLQNRGGNSPFFGFSADGKVFGGICLENKNNEQYGVVRLWTVADGKEARVLDAPAKKKDDPRYFPNGVSFSPDGKHMAAIGNDGQRNDAVRVWEIETGKMLPAFTQPRQGGTIMDVFDALFDGQGEVDTLIAAPQFSPDGKLLVGVVQNNRRGGARLRVWDLATNKHLRDLPEINNGINHVAFSPDGKRLAVLQGDGTVHLCDPRTGKESTTVGGGNVFAFVFAPGGKKMALGTAEGIVLYDLEADKEQHKLTGYQGQNAAMNFNGQQQGLGASIAFAPDGQTIAGTAGAMVRLWSVETGKEIRPIEEGHATGVSSVAVSPDGKWLASLGDDLKLLMWDAATGKVVRQCDNPAEDANNPNALVNLLGVASGGLALQFAPDGKTLAGALHDGSVQLWDATSGKTLRKIGQMGVGPSLAFAVNGKALATGSGDGRVIWWDVASGKQLRQFAGPVAAAGDDDPMAILRMNRGENGPATVAVSPDGRTLAAVGTWNGKGLRIQMWELATGKLRRAIAVQADGGNVVQRQFIRNGRFISTTSIGASSLAFAPDSKTLAWANGTTVRLYDGLRGQEIRQFGHDGSSSGLSFAPDGQTLAASSNDGSVRLWDVARGTVLGQMYGHRGPVNALAFLKDGRTLASAGADTTVLLWDVKAAIAAPLGALTRPRSPEELGALWTLLADEDAAKAFDVVEKLMAVPAQAVPYLSERVPVVPPLDAAKIAQLIADLESDRFATRKKATDELEKLGEMAGPALQKCIDDNPPLAVKQRVESLLEKLKGPVTHPDKCRALRAVEVLERIGTPEAIEVLRKVAKGAPEAELTRDAQAALRRAGSR